MKFRPTRPQLRREFDYLALRLGALLAGARAACAVRRGKLVLVAGGILCLAVLGAALIESHIVGDDRSATVSPTTQAVPSPLPTASAPPAPPAPTPPNPPAPKGRTHLVTAGETLSAMAVRYGVPYEQIAAENGIPAPYRVHAGQRLVLMARPPGVEVIAPGSTLASYARRFGTTVERLRQLNPHITDPDRIVAGAALRTRQP